MSDGRVGSAASSAMDSCLAVDSESNVTSPVTFNGLETADKSQSNAEHVCEKASGREDSVRRGEGRLYDFRPSWVLVL